MRNANGKFSQTIWLRMLKEILMESTIRKRLKCWNWKILFSLNAKRTVDSNDTWSQNRRSFCNQYISRKVYIPMCFVVCFLAHLSWKLKWAFRSSVVRRLSVCLSVCPSVCKLFTFSSSSPEPLGQFQPNLAQSILGWRGFKFVHMKGSPF